MTKGVYLDATRPWARPVIPSGDSFFIDSPKQNVLQLHVHVQICVNNSGFFVHLVLQNFTHQFTSYGNCWTFNSGEDNDILRENQPGSGNGLFMIIDIKQVSHVKHQQNKTYKSFRQVQIVFLLIAL